MEDADVAVAETPTEKVFPLDSLQTVSARVAAAKFSPLIVAEVEMPWTPVFGDTDVKTGLGKYTKSVTDASPNSTPLLPTVTFVLLLNS